MFYLSLSLRMSSSPRLILLQEQNYDIHSAINKFIFLSQHHQTIDDALFVNTCSLDKKYCDCKIANFYITATI